LNLDRPYTLYPKTSDSDILMNARLSFTIARIAIIPLIIHLCCGVSASVPIAMVGYSANFFLILSAPPWLNETNILRRNEILRFQIINAAFLQTGLHLLGFIMEFIIKEQLKTIEKQGREAISLTHLAQRASKLAKRAEQAKNIFLASISHELRNSVHSLINSLELIDDQHVKEQQTLLTTSRFCAGRLASLVDNVLDVMHILHDGTLRVRLRPMNLSNVVTRLQNMITPSECVALSFTVAPTTPEYVICDPNRLMQLLFNTLSNAVKFTAKGFVKLSVTWSAKLAEATFTISDSGIGMSEEVQHQLYHPFSIISEIRKVYGGTGLGLYLVKHIVTQLKGRVKCKSSEGKGTIFAIKIPMQVHQEMIATIHLQQHSPKPKPVLQILVVDDILTNRIVLGALCKRLGCVPTFCQNGAEALEAVKGSKHFDIIFMDIMMPVMDGITASRLIRKHEEESKKNPIYIAALSGVMSLRTQQECMASMNLFLNKPASFQTISKVVQKFCSRRY